MPYIILRTPKPSCWTVEDFTLGSPDGEPMAALVDSAGKIVSWESIEAWLTPLRRFYETAGPESVTQYNAQRETDMRLENDKANFIQSASPTPGWVYFITDGKQTKIGRTIHLESRLRQLQAASTKPLSVTHAIRTNDICSVEARFHSVFADKRVFGEWFMLNDDDLACIKAYCMDEMPRPEKEK